MKTVAEELQYLYDKNKILRAEDVVEYAKNPKTALHDKFTWDDTTAAHQYRLLQARNIIRVTVQIVPEVGDKESRVFVSLYDDRVQPRGGYRSLVSVMKNAALRERLLGQALSELTALQEKYATLTELAKVWQELDKVVKKKKAA